jgi:hypothetical protein
MSCEIPSKPSTKISRLVTAQCRDDLAQGHQGGREHRDREDWRDFQGFVSERELEDVAISKRQN